MLVFPGKFKAPDPQVPLALLYFAASLKQEGFNVRILDMRLEDYRQFESWESSFCRHKLHEWFTNQVCFRVCQVCESAESFMPACLGRRSPDLLPEQTASNDYVDIVVRGEGELIIKDLANALALNRPLDDVAGITYNVNGSIRSNPDGKIIDLDAIPIALPYDLLQMDKYPSFKSGRFHIQTSRGCPHRCGFCYNSIQQERWRGKSAKRVLDEIEYITKKVSPHQNHRPNRRQRFCGREPSEEICHGILERKLDVQWRANCRFDYLVHLR